VDGVSQKVLSQTLKKLERDGMVQRQVFATVPVTFEYSLTGLGVMLSEVIEPLCHWAESNIRAVHEAQRRFDASHAQAE
jgi:DNA-binding HxlR family transcriptional regulator